jgi:cyclopropane fatty-acyl-phospholipid synthase-like methyltransferase
MSDIDYSKWADYVISIFDRYGIKPKLIADLGCGTGSFCIEMARRGYDMIGIDSSPDMLNCAMDKAKQCGMPTEKDILWLNQDMTEFELYGTVDAIVCLMDSVNHITKQKNLEKMFKLVKNYLNPGGVFIFDVNSPYKLSNILGDNVFYSVDDDITYIWQNSYNSKTGICRFDLTFFIRKCEHNISNEYYERFDEVHYEKAYTTEILKNLIEASGLILIGSFNELSFRKPNAHSQRLFFVSRKGE